MRNLASAYGTSYRQFTLIATLFVWSEVVDQANFRREARGACDSGPSGGWRPGELHRRRTASLLDGASDARMDVGGGAGSASPPRGAVRGPRQAPATKTGAPKATTRQSMLPPRAVRPVVIPTAERPGMPAAETAATVPTLSSVRRRRRPAPAFTMSESRVIAVRVVDGGRCDSRGARCGHHNASHCTPADDGASSCEARHDGRAASTRGGDGADPGGSDALPPVPPRLRRSPW